MFEVRNTELSYTGTKPFAGFYPFLNLKTPDNIAMLQIAGTNGNLYYRGKQSANVTMSGVAWAHIRDSANWGVSLYNNSSGNNGTITLSETAANFQYIEIFYGGGGGQHRSVKVYSPNGKVANLIWTTHDTANIVFRSANYSISGTAISRTSETKYDKYNNTITSSTETTIYKVIGYR